jgi:hypothetical protein
MSSPTRRSRSADALHRAISPSPLRRENKVPNLSTNSSTDSIFFDCQESDNGILPILKNIQYCLHKTLTSSNPDQLKIADKILKKDSNRTLEKAIKK